MYKQIQSLNNSGKEVLESYKVNLELEQLKTYAKDAESSQRGFLLTKDSTFIQSYQEALRKANESRASNVEKVFELTDLNLILENTRQELLQRIEKKNVKIYLSNSLPTLPVIPFPIMELNLRINIQKTSSSSSTAFTIKLNTQERASALPCAK